MRYGSEPFFVLAGSITARFDAVASRFADRLAVADDAHSLTYAELSRLVKRIAAVTAVAAAGRAGPVGILLGPEARYPAAILGVLAACRGYVPLDSQNPLERNRAILAEAGVCAIITAGELAALHRADLSIIDLDELPADARAIDQALPDTDDIACILYTSGSTGQPRGIALSHRNILVRVATYVEAARIADDDRLILVYSLSLTGGIYPLYGALLTGASLHMLRPARREPTALIGEIRARAITVYHSVPTLVRHLADALPRGERLESVRVARLSGERAEWSDIDSCRRSFAADAAVLLVLDSTESGSSCQWLVDDAVRVSTVHPPVGRRLADRRVVLIDDDGTPVGEGEVGEVVVTSRAVALGYWQGRTLSIDAFALDGADSTMRTYHTGDFGQWRSDGLLQFVGRKDHTVKLRGYRIEPGEIESALVSLPEVDAGAVVVRRTDDNAARALVAYVTLRRDASNILPGALQSRLAKILPFYMVPSVLFILDELPRLANLKIDRVRLAALDMIRQRERRERAPDTLVAEIAGIFAAALRIEAAHADDTVASVGGDSLHALIIAEEIERRYCVALPTGFVEQWRTVSDIARWIEARAGARPTSGFGSAGH